LAHTSGGAQICDGELSIHAEHRDRSGCLMREHFRRSPITLVALIN
jgi:hypothetical protein